MKMHFNGIVDENDLYDITKQVQTCTRKIDDFGD